jgi:hypothetical protein
VKCVFRLRTDWNKALFTFSEYPYNEVDELAKYEHERWKREKEAQGWKYGPEMNSDRLEHPDIIEWEKLPELSKDNNRAIIRGLPGILAEVGFDIDRQPRPAVTANHE